LNLKIDVDNASNLLSGIISATDNFQNPETSPLSFEMAALLMRKGAVRQMARRKQSVIKEDSFFTPASNAAYAKSDFAYPKPEPQKPSFSKTSIGTEEKKPSFAKATEGQARVDEDNPPDDWLAPKIYKGSTNI